MLTGTTTKEESRSIMNRLNPNSKVADRGAKEIKLCYVTVCSFRQQSNWQGVDDLTRANHSLRRLRRARRSCLCWRKWQTRVFCVSRLTILPPHKDHQPPPITNSSCSDRRGSLCLTSRA